MDFLCVKLTLEGVQQRSISDNKLILLSHEVITVFKNSFMCVKIEKSYKRKTALQTL